MKWMDGCLTKCLMSDWEKKLFLSPPTMSLNSVYDTLEMCQSKMSMMHQKNMSNLLAAIKYMYVYHHKVKFKITTIILILIHLPDCDYYSVDTILILLFKFCFQNKSTKKKLQC